MKLVLLGTADSMKDAPYMDATWEIWGCQPVVTFPVCKRVDRLFELHDDSYWKDPNIITRLNVRGAPVMMQKKVPEIPASEMLPIDEMVAKFKTIGFLGARYFTSTIAYMLAYALYLNMTAHRTGEGYDILALYGVHMAADEEYGNQRQALEYWAGVANGMGVKVIVPEKSSICAAKFLYGYDSESTMLTEMRKMATEFQQTLEQAKGRTDKDVQMMYELGGGLKMLEKLRRLYS